MNETIESCSFANLEYNVPGNLFLINGWEERNPIPNCGVLVLTNIKETEDEDKQ
jgi:hypothetical protein